MPHKKENVEHMTTVDIGPYGGSVHMHTHVCVLCVPGDIGEEFSSSSKF